MDRNGNAMDRNGNAMDENGNAMDAYHFHENRYPFSVFTAL
jgi:hypothetical protein